MKRFLILLIAGTLMYGCESDSLKTNEHVKTLSDAEIASQRLEGRVDSITEDLRGQGYVWCLSSGSCDRSKKMSLDDMRQRLVALEAFLEIEYKAEPDQPDKTGFPKYQKKISLF